MNFGTLLKKDLEKLFSEKKLEFNYLSRSAFNKITSSERFNIFLFKFPAIDSTVLIDLIPKS